MNTAKVKKSILQKLKEPERLPKDYLAILKLALGQASSTDREALVNQLDVAIKSYYENKKKNNPLTRKPTKSQTKSKQKNVKSTKDRKALKAIHNPLAAPGSDASPRERLRDLRIGVRIGLGLQSKVTLPKIRREDVSIDKQTRNKNQFDKHILYAAGWSLSDEDSSE